MVYSLTVLTAYHAGRGGNMERLCYSPTLCNMAKSYYFQGLYVIQGSLFNFLHYTSVLENKKVIVESPYGLDEVYLADNLYKRYVNMRSHKPFEYIYKGYRYSEVYRLMYKNGKIPLRSGETSKT